MKSCTFFGHRQIWENIDDVLTNVLVDFIENQGVAKFYVGNQGDFDRILINRLRCLKKRYPDIKYYIVLAHLPTKGSLYTNNYLDTIYPEGLENILPKYAIIKRNQWMIEHSDIIVTYIESPIGGAAKAKKYAEKKGKKIINIAKMSQA